MPEITVPANGKYPDQAGARSIFIDSIEGGAELVMEIAFADNRPSERHVIRSGSKFNSPDFVIDKIIFHNDSGADVDVDYHVSGLVLYDEARAVGDVNALTRFDNLTLDGNKYFGGFESTASVGNYSVVLLWNPVGSGFEVEVSAIKLSCPGATAWITYVTALPGGLIDYTAFYGLEHAKVQGDANGVCSIYVGALATLTGRIARVPTDTAGSMTPFDFGNTPLMFKEGRGLLIAGGIVNSKTAANFEWQESAL